MTYLFPNQDPTLEDTQLIAALSRLFTRAETFYQRSAERVGSGNLRRQFAVLAELHQHILDLFPAAESIATDIEAISELDDWYNDQLNPTALPAIQQQLAKQLQLQKNLIRSCDLRQHKKNLLHFTASLQIAADQLAEIKTC